VGVSACRALPLEGNNQSSDFGGEANSWQWRGQHTLVRLHATRGSLGDTPFRAVVATLLRSMVVILIAVVFAGTLRSLGYWLLGSWARLPNFGGFNDRHRALFPTIVIRDIVNSCQVANWCAVWCRTTTLYGSLSCRDEIGAILVRGRPRSHHLILLVQVDHLACGLGHIIAV
jgi:hypothetical protein